MKSFHFLQALIAGCCILPGCVSPPPPVPQGPVGRSAMVVSAHPLATAAGLAILKKGGNAVDAAVAVHMALAVVLPSAGNIGGGGFLVARQADGATLTLDFREKAPQAANRDMYLDPQGEPVPSLSMDGLLAVGVPGSVAGMWAAHDSLGTLPWKEVVQPAIDLAARGFALTGREAEGLEALRPRLDRHNPGFTRYRKTSGAWAEGDSIRHPELAHALSLIRDQGRDGFYRGPLADSLVAYMQAGGGILTLDDLAAYQPVWRPPLHGTFQDFSLTTMGPPSAGGVLLLQALGMLELKNMRPDSFSSPAWMHLVAECEKRAFADRAHYLGDPDYIPVPVAALLDPAYLGSRIADFDPLRATSPNEITHGEAGPDQTTHFSIIDPLGNAVAVTTTLNGGYGAAVVVPGMGFLLNNEMDDFSVKPGSPNMYGLVGSAANAIAPGKRMLSSMTPSIITRNGKLWMVIGTPGGATIPTSVLQVFLRAALLGESMQQAVSGPRFHCQWKPEYFYVEKDRFPAHVLEALQRMGHVVQPRSPIGRVDAILVWPDGSLEGGADPRGDDFAGGF